MSYNFCPKCGCPYHQKETFIWRGDSVMCRTCGWHGDPAVLGRAELKTDINRLIIACVFLSERLQEWTRLDMAAHLGMSKTPTLRSKLDTLPHLVRRQRPHPRTTRPTLYYSRVGLSQTKL